jgi:hypothetical protein
VDEAQEQQVADFTKQLKNKLTRLRRESNSVPDNSEEAGQIINRVTKQARDYDALEAQAPSRAEARVEKDMFAPEEIKRGDEETFTEKVDAEREADDLMSDSRRQQEHQDAVEKVRESRAKQLEKFPEGMERQSIEEETANKAYDVEASRVVEPATPEEITQRQTVAKPQADELNTNTFYHGTQVDVSELDNGTNRIFSAIDPDAGGTSTEMGVGVHLTNAPTVAENHAQALPPLNRPQLPDTKHLERGAVHQVTTDVQVPIRADVNTQDLPGDLGDVVRDVVKKVGAEHAPSSAFARTFKRSIRKNRSFERYLDQFRRQLAEDGNISEQRIRAFQRDVTRNLRLKGVDSVFSKRGEETVANVLFPERIRQVSSNYDLPEANTLSRKQARKFVDEQSDIGLQTTKANRIQSEFSLADELGQTHKQAHEESAREALSKQQVANEKRSQLAEETKAQQKQELEGAKRAMEEDADDVVNRDWNPTNPTQQEDVSSAPTAEEAQREVERLIKADSQEDPNIDEDEVEAFLDEFGGLDPDSPERINMQRIKNNFMECD